jgi:RimJ/RimL family protein N-acetyltransferase
MTILETERLRLRTFDHSDSGFLIQLLNTPGWLRFIGDRNVRNHEEAIMYLENGPIKSYRENGYGLSLVETKNEKIPAGSCGLLKRDFLEHPDIGFAFLPEFAGQGYAYEIASAVMNHARKNLGLKTITAITLPENERSINLLKKLGMHFDRTIIYPGTEEELSLYATIK